jgi:glycosyltransferase involved in cell wall biosynthesis
MRVALDGTVVRPPLTGVHYAVRHGLQALLAALPPGAAVCYATDEELRATALHHGHTAPRLSPWLRSPVSRLWWQQTILPGLLRRAHAEVLFAPAYTAPLRCPVPTVVQVHDLLALCYPDLCRRRNVLHLRLLMPPSLRRAAALLVSSPPVAAELAGLTGRPLTDIHVVPLGVDPLLLTAPVAPPPPGLPAGRYVLCLATLEPKKDVDTLLAAWPQVAGALPDAHLVIAGQAGWRCDATLRRLHQLADCRVTWLGYVPRRAVPGLYDGAAVVAFPSRQEGFGLPVLEAMARGCPVVHSDHPVLLATAGGLGLPFALGNPEALAAALLVALTAAPDAAAAARRRAWAAAHPWSRWAEAVTALLAQVAASRA